MGLVFLFLANQCCSLLLEHNVDRVEFHIVRDNTLHKRRVAGGLDKGFVHDLDFQIVSVVRVVVVVDLENVGKRILSDFKVLLEVVKIELLDAAEKIAYSLSTFFGEATAFYWFEWGNRGKVAKQLVRLLANRILLLQFLQNGALVNATENHLHRGCAWFQTESSSCELIKHECQTTKNALEAEDLIFCH